ncbi:3,4-dihydroxy-2-butanone 4-phosphate synthase [Calocera cornea HHB12733]|uniref:3,4-dihydroxy-2-butanone 4-phosphate synthase n=1 Tax=Calocera cornea HHB12733 TaxID=1353952 RepID=A0A165DK41_9BASI|nr:3,4-dihydroxy-2-butanone 4-phosphate synthase [Calocera cornea HHB12733]
MSPVATDPFPARAAPSELKSMAAPAAATNGAATKPIFDPMPDALAAFARGEFLVVMDDESRENEGDLIVPAAHITTEQMAWFIKHSSGYICISLPGERLDELALPLMVPLNEERHKTAYTITADYKHGTSTGISAHDRALTARMMAQGGTAEDFNRPGHMVPLRAREGGVLTRKGHTESALDLCYLTSQPPAGLLCELVNDDPQGSMARRDDCRAFADRWGLNMISVEMIARWRREHGDAGV